MRVIIISASLSAVLIFGSVLNLSSAASSNATESVYRQLMQATLTKDSFAEENEDFGISPVNRVYEGKVGKPTPVSIPGATTITTGELLRLMQGNTNLAIVDVGFSRRAESVPYAMYWRDVGKGKKNKVRTAQLDFMLKQIKWAQPYRPVVFLSGPRKEKDTNWLSYNAALRAAKLGYTHIYWYRGGQKSWKEAGLPTISLMPPHKR